MLIFFYICFFLNNIFVYYVLPMEAILFLNYLIVLIDDFYQSSKLLFMLNLN